MVFRCAFTVFSESASLPAICLLLNPCETYAMISCYLPVMPLIFPVLERAPVSWSKALTEPLSIQTC